MLRQFIPNNLLLLLSGGLLWQVSNESTINRTMGSQNNKNKLFGINYLELKQ